MKPLCVWPFELKLSSSAFMWYCLLLRISKLEPLLFVTSLSYVVLFILVLLLSLNQADPNVDLSKVNLAPEYSEDYPIIFNIWLWLLVVLVLTIYVVCLVMWYMDPGRDSIIYRMTSQRIKTDWLTDFSRKTFDNYRIKSDWRVQL